MGAIFACGETVILARDMIFLRSFLHFSFEIVKILADMFGRKRTKEEEDAVWCLVANVVEELPCGSGSTQKRRGTKHFLPGAKVHCYPVLWGDGYERIKVIGRH